MVQTDESGQDHCDQSGGGKKWLDSEYTLEEFADGPEMGKRQRGEVKHNSKAFGLSNYKDRGGIY